jgi:hypothetical protein
MTCSKTLTNTLAFAAHKWRVRAFRGGAWRAWSAFKNFQVTQSPTPQLPAGTISDDTPTYQWTKVQGATQYRYVLLQGASTIYTQTVGAGACGAATCSNTPATSLTPGSYQWKVQAHVGGVWKPYSALKNFTLMNTSIQAGFWQSPPGWHEFWVTPDQANVDEFTTYVTVFGCGDYTITRATPTPIVNGEFTFTGSYYGGGTFDSPTSAHGTSGLDNFFIAGCGSVSGGPWDWTATWQHANPPLVNLEDPAEVLTKLVSGAVQYHIVDKVIKP